MKIVSDTRNVLHVKLKKKVIISLKTKLLAVQNCNSYEDTFSLIIQAFVCSHSTERRAYRLWAPYQVAAIQKDPNVS